MAEPKEYNLVYTHTFEHHLNRIEAKYYSLVRKTIENQLKYDAEVKTRNRKPLKKPLFKAEWELRFGPQNRFRIFYRVEGEEAIILALGEKEGNHLRIEGEGVES